MLNLANEYSRPIPTKTISLYAVAFVRTKIVVVYAFTFTYTVNLGLLTIRVLLF